MRGFSSQSAFVENLNFWIFPRMLVFWSLAFWVRNSVVLAVYLLFSVACFPCTGFPQYLQCRKRGFCQSSGDLSLTNTYKPAKRKMDVDLQKFPLIPYNTTQAGSFKRLAKLNLSHHFQYKTYYRKQIAYAMKTYTYIYSFSCMLHKQPA